MTKSETAIEFAKFVLNIGYTFNYLHNEWFPGPFHNDGIKTSDEMFKFFEKYKKEKDKQSTTSDICESVKVTLADSKTLEHDTAGYDTLS